MALKWDERKNWHRTELVLDLTALEKDDRLATISHGLYGGGAATATIWTVERFTPTRVYLTAGRGQLIFRLSDGRQIGEYGSSDKLKDPADPAVVLALQGMRMRSFQHELEETLKLKVKTLTDMDRALTRVRELEEECRADLARMELTAKEVKTDA